MQHAQASGIATASTLRGVSAWSGLAAEVRMGERRQGRLRAGRSSSRAMLAPEVARGWVREAALVAAS